MRGTNDSLKIGSTVNGNNHTRMMIQRLVNVRKHKTLNQRAKVRIWFGSLAAPNKLGYRPVWHIPGCSVTDSLAWDPGRWLPYCAGIRTLRWHRPYRSEWWSRQSCPFNQQPYSTIQPFSIVYFMELNNFTVICLSVGRSVSLSGYLSTHEQIIHV